MKHLGEYFEIINPFEELKRTVTISTLHCHSAAREKVTIIQGIVWYIRKGLLAFESERTGFEFQQPSR